MIEIWIKVYWVNDVTSALPENFFSLQLNFDTLFLYGFVLLLSYEVFKALNLQNKLYLVGTGNFRERKTSYLRIEVLNNCLLNYH